MQTKSIPARTRTTGPGEREAAGPAPSKVWALLEAMAYAGAFIDPTGIMVAEAERRRRGGAA
jgi:hypothetical protein